MGKSILNLGRLTAFAYLCSSDKSVSELVRVSKQFSKRGKFVLLLKNSSRVLDYLLPACLNACIRYREGSMRSKSLDMEVLIFAARTMRLDKAIKGYGADSSVEFIMFSNDRESAEEFIKRVGVSCKRLKLEFNKNAAAEVTAAGLAE